MPAVVMPRACGVSTGHVLVDRTALPGIPSLIENCCRRKTCGVTRVERILPFGRLITTRGEERLYELPDKSGGYFVDRDGQIHRISYGAIVHCMTEPYTGWEPVKENDKKG